MGFVQNKVTGNLVLVLAAREKLSHAFLKTNCFIYFFFVNLFNTNGLNIILKRKYPKKIKILQT